jgi:hypothetical protein
MSSITYGCVANSVSLSSVDLLADLTFSVAVSLGPHFGQEPHLDRQRRPWE